MHFGIAFAAALALAAGQARGQSGHPHPQPPAPAAGAPAWTAAPLLLPAAGRPERGRLRLQPVNLAAATVDVLAPAPGASARAFAVEAGVAAVVQPDPAVGNYQWATARQSRPGEERLASTAWYVSNPGPAPSAMLAAARPGLAVVPRLPREHGSYREGESWDFALRFDGRPVPGAELTLETEFGTRTRAVADADGVARFVFPRDFDPARLAGGEHGGRASRRFAVSAELERQGTRYLSAFNSTYSPAPERSRDLAAGAGFLLLGMAAATPLLRRRKEAA